ncbi:hypothetical protein GGU10DRAFT_341606 [Lentinula aff. detonsa]|uniref:Uncharacterized protein n=1 Tax=Lentinula aff. detonsa TaxID=2804958 RepID=A0AA38NS14_9AGAR|nr:hypothetical protein GGU10DRAFT_341606 [Lentinula aff. detonsa]
MPSSMTPAYPPSAHVSRKASSSVLPTAPVVAQQPSATRSMSLMSAEEREQRNSQVQRLRGGCIPCPDGGCCFIIPCCL